MSKHSVIAILGDTRRITVTMERKQARALARVLRRSLTVSRAVKATDTEWYADRMGVLDLLTDAIQRDVQRQTLEAYRG